MVKTILLSLLGLLVLAIVVVCVIASQRPDSFRVARSQRIEAPASRIFPLINDVHAFNTWNPYNHKDPQMKGSYRGPAAGPGAAYDFESNKAGSGNFEITQSTPSAEVRMRLVMTAPFAADNQVRFVLKPLGDGTEVTWAMEGPAPFISRVMGVIFNMDRMIGADFENGLSTLKDLAEKPAAPVVA